MLFSSNNNYSYKYRSQLLHVINYNCFVFMKHPTPLLSVIFARCQLTENNVQTFGIVGFFNNRFCSSNWTLNNEQNFFENR